MRKTKIICAIGPACASEEVLEKMCLAGMNCARINCSHGTHAEHLEKIERIKKVRRKLGLPISIMLDTKGPEYRIGTFRAGSVRVEDGAEFTFTTEDVPGDENRVSVNYKGLIGDLQPGDTILVNNGISIFRVERLEGNNAHCRTIAGGVLSDRKSMSFPNKVMSGPYLSEQDKKDILFGIANDVDFIAASFVSTAGDVRSVRELLDANGGSDIDIIAKIENQAGVDNVDEICNSSEGVIVARGDLGVEIPYVEIPAVQKQIIEKCRRLGKRVLIATEMLESMIVNPRPTRAEISDVANAVYDGTSVVMLSGETAVGKYPVESVENMARICESAEAFAAQKRKFYSQQFSIGGMLDALSHAACALATDVDAKAMVVCSVSGKTAQMVSRFRCPMDILGLTTSERVWRKLGLTWGVVPVLTRTAADMDAVFAGALEAAREVLPLQNGDRLVSPQVPSTKEGAIL